jgi:hypothetical protein
MADTNSDHRVRVISQTYTTWKVQVLFGDDSLSAAEVADRLKEVKAELASQFGIPDSLLEYHGILNKQTTRNGLLVQMQIVKQSVLSGSPRFQSLPLRAEDGTMYTDMRVVADLYPYDKFDRPLSTSVVEALYAAAGYELEFVNWDNVNKALKELSESDRPVLSFEIARGILPSPGISSRLTYGIRPEQESFLGTAWMGVRPVKNGDFIVEVSHPVSGHKWGRNVYGRELDPRPGRQVRLEAGRGAKLVLRGSRLAASEDGLLVFERHGRDRRETDSYDLIPAKLVAHVLPLTVVTDPLDTVLNLEDATLIQGKMPNGIKINSRTHLLIAASVEPETIISCSGSLRVTGSVRKANLVAGHHLCIHGDIQGSELECPNTLQADSHTADSILRAADVIARDIHGGQVDALRQPSIAHVGESNGSATAVRINLRRFLEKQQEAGCVALEELRQSLSQISDIFGPDITLQASEGNPQRMLLRWLRKQKTTLAINYTHAEVQEFKTILEMVPVIRQQLLAIGMELREVTSQLVQAPNSIPIEPPTN